MVRASDLGTLLIRSEFVLETWFNENNEKPSILLDTKTWNLA